MTWLGEPNGSYAIRAEVISVDARLVRIRVARPSRLIPSEKSVHTMSLRAGPPIHEKRWDGELVTWND